MKIDVEKFVKGLHEYFEKELSPFYKRLSLLEARQPERGEKGEPGLNGKDGATGAAGITGQRGEKGESGLNGKDGAAGVAGIKGERGEKGDPGLNGKDGVSGAAGINGEPGLNGKDGAAGIKGERGEKGESGVNGKDGRDGKDGNSVSEADIEKIVERQVAVWALDFERRAAEVLSRAIDKMPEPKDGINGKDGVDGKDGLGFDDLSIVQLDSKRLKFIFISGDQKKEFVLKMPIVEDKGVFSVGKAYLKGDGVTYAGSFWIAQVDNPNQSPGKGAEWRLAVKRGRDAQEVKS